MRIRKKNGNGRGAAATQRSGNRPKAGRPGRAGRAERPLVLPPTSVTNLCYNHKSGVNLIFILIKKLTIVPKVILAVVRKKVIFNFLEWWW